MQISLCTPRSCNLRHPQTLVSAWESDCWKLTRLTLPGLSPWGLPAAQEVQNGEEKQSKRDCRLCFGNPAWSITWEFPGPPQDALFVSLMQRLEAYSSSG